MSTVTLNMSIFELLQAQRLGTTEEFDEQIERLLVLAERVSGEKTTSV